LLKNPDKTPKVAKLAEYSPNIGIDPHLGAKIAKLETKTTTNKANKHTMPRTMPRKDSNNKQAGNTTDNTNPTDKQPTKTEQLDYEKFAQSVANGESFASAYFKAGGQSEKKSLAQQYGRDIAKRPYVKEMIVSFSSNISDPKDFSNNALESMYINRSRASLADVLRWDKHGKITEIVPSDEIDRDVAARISSIKTDFDPETKTTYIREVKLYDPQPYANRLTDIRNMVKNQAPQQVNQFNIKNLLIDASVKNQENLKRKLSKITNPLSEPERTPEVEVMPTKKSKKQS